MFPNYTDTDHNDTHMVQADNNCTAICGSNLDCGHACQHICGACIAHTNKVHLPGKLHDACLLMLKYSLLRKHLQTSLASVDMMQLHDKH